jgi:hypothetical protein
LNLTCKTRKPFKDAYLASGLAAELRRLPELAIRDLPAGSFNKVSDALLKSLRRELVLAWNPRVIDVGPRAVKVLTELGTALKF